MIPFYDPNPATFMRDYGNVPLVDLLFRNFNLQFYFRPTALGWHEWYVVDDFGNLARVSLSSYRDQPRSELH